MDTLKITKSNFNNPFIALKHKNFRYFWTSMCISMIGTWMQGTAQPWLAYSITKSPFLLGLVGVFQFTPVLLFSLFAGVLVDKFPKKRILLVTQTASMLITLILAILTWTGYVQYWHILVTATLMGCVNTLDIPTRQSFVIELVGKDDLMNAIALNSSVFNIARMIGPALAGLIMGFAGPAACFFANSLSFAAVIGSLHLIKPGNVYNIQKSTTKILDEIKDGLKYIIQNDILLKAIIITAIVGTFAMNFNVLVPVFAREILKQEGAGFGLLMSLMGIGSFCGAMLMATMSKSGPKKLILYGAPILISAFLIFTGLTNIFILTGIGLALTGFSFVSFGSTANSTIQLNTSNKYRGRVMSVYTLVFAGSTPLGNLYAGFITDRLDARWGFVTSGIIIIVLFGILIIREKVSKSIKLNDMVQNNLDN